MGERRALGEAMTLTPEKLAFIQTGAANTEPKPVESTVDSVIASVDRTSNAVQGTRQFSRSQQSRSSRSLPSTPTPTEPIAEEGIYSHVLIPLTTRLQPRTAEALRRACLERKLARQTPNSQQEIVELAVSHWLREQKFLN